MLSKNLSVGLTYCRYVALRAQTDAIHKRFVEQKVKTHELRLELPRSLKVASLFHLLIF